MAKAPKVKSEATWEAERDAQTMAEAEAIKADKTRLRRASTAAKRLSREAAAKAAGMKRVAKQGTTKGSRSRRR